MNNNRKIMILLIVINLSLLTNSFKFNKVSQENVENDVKLEGRVL